MTIQLSTTAQVLIPIVSMLALSSAGIWFGYQLRRVVERARPWPNNYGALRIAMERQSHFEGGKWSPEHDDAHANGELAEVAGCLAFSVLDPWGLLVKHEKDRIKQLTVAGALIAAEIDRLLRKENSK